MQDGATWIKVGEGLYCNLAQIAFLQEGANETILTAAGGQGSPAQPVRVSDADTRKQIHALVERGALEAQTAAKDLATAGAGRSRY